MSKIGIHTLDPNLSFGARVTGVTHDVLKDEATREELRQLFRKVGVIHFEDVEPTPEMQVDAGHLARAFHQPQARKHLGQQRIAPLGLVA